MEMLEGYKVIHKFIVKFKYNKRVKCHLSTEDQTAKLCDGLETVTKFSYLSNRLNAGGGCTVTIISKTILGWVKLGKFKEMLHRKRFHL